MSRKSHIQNGKAFRGLVITTPKRYKDPKDDSCEEYYVEGAETVKNTDPSTDFLRATGFREYTHEIPTDILEMYKNNPNFADCEIHFL